jgi:hypothetical protein
MNRKPIFDAVKRLRGGKAWLPDEIKALDAAIDEAEGITKPPFKLARPDTFYSNLRAALGPLGQSQVDGINAILSVLGDERWPLAWASYGLATAWWETAKTMQPVREAYWKDEAWRKRNLAKYYPHYGRGYVQLTWPFNYAKADDELHMGGALIADLDLALDPTIAAAIMAKGMEAGWFTAKGLGDYLPTSGVASVGQYRDARRIINGQDKASEIAAIAKVFEGALNAGGWGQ